MRYILLVFLLLSSLYASKQDSLYTQEEQKWLNQNPLIKIAVMEYWPSDSSGESLHTSLLKLLNRYGGLNLVAAKYDKWSEGFADASKGRELHGIMGIVKNPQRDRDYFDFTKPYEYIPIYIVVKQEDETIRSLEDLRNTTLYIKQNSITATMLKEKVPSAALLGLSSIEAMYQALSSTTKAQAIVAQFVDEEALSKYGLKIAKVIYNRYGELSIAIHHDHFILYSIINKAMEKIPPRELSALRDKEWKRCSINLSKQEQEWIKTHPNIVFGSSDSWKPYVIAQQDGSVAGIEADIIAQIQCTNGAEYFAQTWQVGGYGR